MLKKKPPALKPKKELSPALAGNGAAPAAAGPRETSWERMILLGIILFVAVVRINLIQVPYERDEGAYIYFGQMILDGQTPYRDFYEDKPPGNMYMYALSVAAFGPNEGSQHGAFMILNLATLILLYFAARKLVGVAPALCGTAAFAILSLCRSMAGFTCMSEHIVIFFVAAGIILLLFDESPPPWKIFLAGAALGMSCWVKQTGIFCIAWGTVAALMAAPEKSAWTRRARDFGYFFAGVAAVSAIFAGLILYLGVFKEFWFATVQLPKLFVTNEISLPFIKEELQYFGGDILQSNPALCALAALGLILQPILKFTRARSVSLNVLMLCSLLTVLPGWTFYNHYWLQVIPAAALFVAIAVAALIQLASRLRRGPKWLPTAVVAAVFSCCALFNISRNWQYYFGDDYTPTIRKSYGLNPFVSAKIVGQYLNNHTKPGEPLAIFGSEPEIFLYADCRNATRHAFISHFLDARNPYSEAWQNEYMSDIEKAAPRYFVKVINPYSINWDGKTGRKVFKWLDLYLKQHYTLVGLVEIIPDEIHPLVLWGKESRAHTPHGPWTGVYRRNPPPGPAPANG